MAYMLLVVEKLGDRAARSPSEGLALYDRMLRFSADLQERGQLTLSQSLKTDVQGVRVTRQGDKSMVRDGPFAETKEMIGGLAVSVSRQVATVKEMSSSLSGVNGLSQEISSATEEQATNARQVARAVENVNELTQAAASAAEQMSSATERLSGMARRLQELTAKFRISEETLPVGARHLERTG